MGRTIIGIPCKCDRRNVPPRRPSIYERHRWDLLMDIKKDHPRLPVLSSLLVLIAGTIPTYYWWMGIVSKAIALMILNKR